MLALQIESTSGYEHSLLYYQEFILPSVFISTGASNLVQLIISTAPGLRYFTSCTFKRTTRKLLNLQLLVLTFNRFS